MQNAMTKTYTWRGLPKFYKQGFGSTGGEGERKGLQGGVVMQDGFFRGFLCGFLWVFLGFFGFFQNQFSRSFYGFSMTFWFLVRVFVNF